MSVPAILDPQGALSTELKCMICDLLLVDSLKIVRLVGKEWSSAAGMILWQTFRSDLEESNNRHNREIDALVQSKTVPDMIKQLDLNADGIGHRDFPSTVETSNHLLRLLSVLPRDCLRAFTTNFDLDEETIGLVLKTQVKLLKLAVPFKTLHVNHLINNLDQLTNLTLISNDNDESSRICYLPFTKALRNLTLKLRSSSTDSGGRYSVWSIPKTKPLLELRSIEIHYTLIQEKESSFGGLTDLSKLEFLLLSNCPGIAVTIQSLTNELLKCGNPALKSLIIRQTDWLNPKEPYDTELESLLEAVPSLETLCITVTETNRPSVESICRNANTLRYLHVDQFPNLFDYTNEDVDEIERYTPQELEQLVSACPDIEGLSLNLVGMNLGNWRPDDTFSVFETDSDIEGNVKLAELLLPITRLRKLRNLRITQPLFHPPSEPEVKGFPFVTQYQCRYQQVADSIMQFLADHDSTVELLAFGPGFWPDFIFPYDSFVDINGHYAHRYYYRRGTMTAEMGGGRQVTRLVAVPVVEKAEHEEIIFRNGSYTSTELEILAARCPHVEELGIHVAVINISSVDLGVPFTISSSKDLGKALDLLFRFRLLRSLRSTNLLALVENVESDKFDFNESQYYQLASEIMQYLVERGSSIEIFATSPTPTPGLYCVEEDFHGHTRPHYFYVRGTVTIPLRHQHRTQAQAVVTTKKNITDHVRYSSLLFRSENSDIEAY
ncbi:hypothetical protein G6011_00107 [Alternaria panax]|uniref:F-box domain-containing protein n=1 Tax=Alternaria panax TaxID=48097 RepID=A0AAD4II35_9PLEO|nr:hypothetical protein G6011_00107 [Alternaria panax]